MATRRMPLTLPSLMRRVPPSPRRRLSRGDEGQSQRPGSGDERRGAMTVAPADLALAPPAAGERRRGARDYIRRHPTIIVGGVLLGAMVLMAILAPWLGTTDPQALSPIQRLHWPSAEIGSAPTCSDATSTAARFTARGCP